MPKSSAAKVETALYPNGNVKFRGAHLDGEMHGEWAFFRADGSKMRSGAFDRGKQIGVWRTYDRAGKVVKETTFSKGSQRSRASLELWMPGTRPHNERRGGCSRRKTR